MACAQALPIQPQHPSFSSRLRVAVKGMWLAYWHRQAERATVAILGSLDDRTLKDIGMDRSEIEAVVYGPSNDRLSCSKKRIKGATSNRRISMYV